MLNLDEVIGVFDFVVCGKKDFLFGVVHFFLVDEHSLNTDVRTRCVNVVFLCAVFFHLADEIGHRSPICRGFLILAVAVLDEQSVGIDFDILVFVFVEARAVFVLGRAELVVLVIIELPVANAVRHFVNAGVNHLFGVDITCAVCDIFKTKFVFRFFARDVLELRNVDFRCVDCNRQLVIPQIEVDREEFVARLKRFDDTVSEVDRYGFFCLFGRIVVEFRNSDQIVVLKVRNLFALVKLRLCRVCIENINSFCKFDVNVDFLYVIVTCSAILDLFVVCLALGFCHF